MKIVFEELEKRRGDTSIERFANELGVTGNHYRNLLAGKYKPGVPFFEKVLSRYPDALDTIVFIVEE